VCVVFVRLVISALLAARSVPVKSVARKASVIISVFVLMVSIMHYLLLFVNTYLHLISINPYNILDSPYYRLPLTAS